MKKNTYETLKITIDIEKLVVKLYNDKITNRKKIIKLVNEQLFIKIELKHILCIYKKNKLIVNNPVLKRKIDNFIIDSIKINNVLTAKEIALLIKNEFKIQKSKTYIYGILSDYGYTNKKTNIKTNPKTLEEQKLDVLKSKETLELYKHKKIVSMDEMSIHNFEKRTRGWTLEGTECIITIKKGNIRNQRYTYLCAITDSKILDYTFVDNSMKTEKFISFMKKLFKADVKNENVYFMDNAKVHTSKAFKEYVESSGIIVIYNAPYHSEFNPIELVFSLLRKEIQKGVNETKEDIIVIINKFNKDINKNNSETLKKIFNHSFKSMDNFLL